MNTVKTIMDNRKINLFPWEKISITSEIEHHTLIDVATIIIFKDDEYYFIQDDIEKVRDVSIMPQYIKEDWIKYNRKELNMFVINKHIKEYESKLKESVEFNSVKTEKERELEEKLNLLKSLRRDLIIKGII